MPGHSQHQLGTAIDFTNEAIDYVLGWPFADTSAGRWLLEHAHEYGFVQAYPKGGEAETGYQWEPWHYRYIGVENARRLQTSGLSLQAFLLREGVLPR
jgi:D-alanyl-D-alanine carboxypeptidase